MFTNWTFGKKIGAGLALTVSFALAIGALSVNTLHSVSERKDRVLHGPARDLTDIQRLALAAARKSSAIRGYLLSKDEKDLELMRGRRADFLAVLPPMRKRMEDPEAVKLLEQLERQETEHEASASRAIALRKSDATSETIARAFEQDVDPKLQSLLKTLDDLTAQGERFMAQQAEASRAASASAIQLVVTISVLAGLAAVLIALFLSWTLGQQIGAAVSQVQSSSGELQAAANQQSTASKEQATAMNEITTTISELLATSRQIAESAQRVSRMAEQTANAARSGDSIVEQARESIVGIKQQVDRIVSHMLELGRKSQRIGTVLDIVSELAEQTNILAINATIEAAGAGDAGKRFAVVADEIRKLADRVAGSTKEIRSLIEDIRGSVNTSIMTTETGSKAVDLGARQFSDVTSSFGQIAELVRTTTEAAREIELSTKQQATAVEQVNIAVTNVAQATRETEASSGQTLQTASMLSGLSRDLLELVQSRTTPVVSHNSRS